MLGLDAAGKTSILFQIQFIHYNQSFKSFTNFILRNIKSKNRKKDKKMVRKSYIIHCYNMKYVPSNKTE